MTLRTSEIIDGTDMGRLPKSARDLLQTAIDKAGSKNALSRELDVDGAWLWRLQKGEAQGLPSPLLVVKLARYVGTDPYDALRAFGHGELVDLLKG